MTRNKEAVSNSRFMYAIRLTNDAMNIMRFEKIDWVIVSLNCRFLTNCGMAHITYKMLAIESITSLFIAIVTPITNHDIMKEGTIPTIHMPSFDVIILPRANELMTIKAYQNNNPFVITHRA